VGWAVDFRAVEEPKTAVVAAPLGGEIVHVQGGESSCIEKGWWTNPLMTAQRPKQKKVGQKKKESQSTRNG